MRLLVLSGALAIVTSAAAPMSAQSVPNISRIKETTNRAVAKTNAHTLAMTSADSGRPAPAPAGVPNGAAKGTVESPADTAQARGVRATASSATIAATRAPVVDTAGKIVIRREVFAYEQSGRRDPFVSLMTVGELRPMLSDLVIAGILIDPSGRNSIAVLRDLTTHEQYRVRVGQQLGRMRVARIAKKSITFTIEEFGYSRQQELAMEDSNQARTK